MGSAADVYCTLGIVNTSASIQLRNSMVTALCLIEAKPNQRLERPGGNGECRVLESTSSAAQPRC